MRLFAAILLATLPLASSLQAGAPDKRGADYYLAKPGNWLNKSITVYVTTATSQARLVAGNKYTVFTATTVQGDIDVAVPNAQVDVFAKRFSTSTNPKTLTGKFTVYDDGTPLLML